MAYVYLHRRNDTKEVFYVGISVQNSKYRAFSKKRNKIWKSISSRTDYSIEILKDGISFEEAKAIEIELIKFYGKIIDKTGSLANITNGGEGVTGYKHSEKALEKIKINSSLSKNGNSKKCIHFESGKKFDSLREGCIYFNLNYGNECSRIRKKSKKSHFYYENDFFEKCYFNYKLSNAKKGKNNGRGFIVKCNITGNIFKSLPEACKFFNLPYYKNLYDIRKNREGARFSVIKKV